MGVLEKVLSNKFNLEYHGINDYMTGINISVLLEHSQAIISYFSNRPTKIDTVDDFRDYLTLDAIVRYNEVIPNLSNGEDQPRLRSLIDFSQFQLSKYIKAFDQIYTLINEHYQYLLRKDEDDDSQYELMEIVMNYVFLQYDHVDRKVIYFIENEHWEYILQHFEKCINYYKQNQDKLDNLLSKIFQYENNQMYSNIADFLYEYKTVPFIELFKKHAIKLADKAIDLLKTIGEDNYLQVYAYCEDIIKLSRLYNITKQLSEFDRLKPEIEKANCAYMEKHGVLFSKKVDFKPIIEKLKNALLAHKTPTNITFLELTHSYSKVESKFIASICSVFTQSRSALTDVFPNLGLNTNVKFPASVQTGIRLMFEFYDYLITLVINDNEISDVFFEILSRVFEMICKEYNLSYEDLNNELNGIIDALVYLFSIDEKYPYYKTYCFGLSQNICSFIEKLLRKIFIEMYNKDIIYIPESKITLGDILKEDKLKQNKIRDLLSSDLADILIFELHQFDENEKGIKINIGMNLRNKLMHNNDINYMQDIHKNLVAHLFQILVLIIHQLETTTIKMTD